MSERKLVTASILEREHNIKRATVYRLARAGAIPSYRVGPKRSGVRFLVDEVFAALRASGLAGEEPRAALVTGTASDGRR